MRRFGGHVGGILLVVSWLVTTGIAFAQTPDTERRVALVIGDRLTNAGNNATLIADTLQHLGFTVTHRLGVPRDRAEGSRWLTQAAADGYEPAIARLARMQSSGVAPPSPH
ncbi:MAG TPA: hypothetical protein VIZ17_10125 [Acetobacteraceae bacterium]